MIQRIQTLFLLASAILLFVINISHIAQFEIEGSVFFLDSYQFSDIDGKLFQDTHTLIHLVSLIVLAGLLNMVTIFLYKKRQLQIRFCIYSIILQISVIGLILFYTHIARADAEFVRFCFGAFIPLITIILTFLAFKNIRKDDDLIKSLNRIR